MRSDAEALLPVRDPGATLTDLLEVVLNKGVVLHLDLLLSVADIPLVGVSIRAALAGMETMLAHGMLRQWDASTRLWIQSSISRDIPLEPGETVRARMLASVEEGHPYRAWRPGLLYVTDRRLLLFRREPRAILLDLPLIALTRVTTELHEAVGDGMKRLIVLETSGGRYRLLTPQPEAVLELLRGECFEGPSPPQRVPALTGRLWYHEPRSIGGVWRPGVAKLDGNVLTWRASLDERPMVRLALGDLRAFSLENTHPVVGAVLKMTHTRGTLEVGGELSPWLLLIQKSLEEGR